MTDKIYYDSYKEVPCEHIGRGTVIDYKIITTDIDDGLTKENIIKLLSEHPEMIRLSVAYDEADYYGPYFNGLKIEFNRDETDNEYDNRRLAYQKSEYKKHKRPTASALEKQKQNYLRKEAEKARTEAFELKEYNRLKKKFG